MIKSFDFKKYRKTDFIDIELKRQKNKKRNFMEEYHMTLEKARNEESKKQDGKLNEIDT